MATTRLMSLHIGRRSVPTAISDIIGYVENPGKTDGGRLITGYGCNPPIADAEFMLAKREYLHITGRDQGDRNVLAYHIRQSFKPGEIDAETANKIGYELAMSFTKGKHAFIVCTHIDKKHIHNHIIFNSTSLDCERKFKDFKRSGYAVRRISDLLCAENGLSVVEHPKPSRGHYGTWLGDKKPLSFQAKNRLAIDAALEQKPADFEAFLKLMEASGYTVKRGKHIKLTGPGQQRGTRLDTLKGDYTEQAIRERIAGTRIITSGAGGGRAAPEQAGVIRDKPVNLLIDIEEKMRHGKGAGYQQWARVFNIKEAAKTLIFLQENGIADYEDLKVKATAASAHFNGLTAKIKAADKRMEEISALQKHIANYSRTREVYKAYREAGYSAKFKAGHEADIIIHQAAKRFFDSLGLKKLPTIATLKQEYAVLLADKKKTVRRIPRREGEDAVAGRCEIQCRPDFGYLRFDLESTDPRRRSQYTGPYIQRAVTR